MSVLKEVRSNLYRIKLSSIWDKDFYHPKYCGVSPINTDYYPECPFRLLYDGVYTDDRGFALEINVGIISNEAGYYEFFIEDYMGGSICESYTDFDEALKRFVKFTNIRKPKIFTDNENGSAISIEYKPKPFAIVLSE